jgi:5-methylcytosine-specific restriction endonuclease McrA
MIEVIKLYLKNNSNNCNFITIKYLLEHFNVEFINKILNIYSKNNNNCIMNLETLEYMNETFRNNFMNNVSIMSNNELNLLLKESFLNNNDNVIENKANEIHNIELGFIKKKYKKKAIPLALKKLVWNKYIGEEIGKAKCLCCGLTDISQISFNCGHIVAEVNGGNMCIDNLMPICQNCNSSMGSTNLLEFKKMLN